MVRGAVVAALAALFAIGAGLMAAGSQAASGGPLAGAAQLGAASGSESLSLVFPLTADYAGLKQRALEITTPGSPEYGRYESVAALSREFGASSGTRQRVVTYLRSAGAKDVRVDATGLFVDATVSASLSEHLFSTPLARFQARSARFIAPTSAPTVPAPLRGLVTGVVGLDTRPLFGSASSSTAGAGAPLRLLQRRAASGGIGAASGGIGAASGGIGAASGRTGAGGPVAHAAATGTGYLPRTGTPSGCAAALPAQGFTPNQYLTAYGYQPLHSAGLTGQGERVALIEIDGFNYNDIKTFANCFGLRVPQINGYGVGIAHPLAPGGESTLDLEVLDAAAQGLKAIDVYESSAGAAEALRALTAPLQNAGSKPQVISASLGLCEQEVVGAVGGSGIDAAEASLQVAAASGITFLASSGDSGSADCAASDGTPAAQLAVNYPASSWWVTGVGGTNFALNGANQISAQIVWNDGSELPGSAGGGGFSAGFSRPSYQNGTVSRNSRAVPDVSMLADVAPGYTIFCSVNPDCVNGSSPNPWTDVGGTSAGTPLLAGGLAIVDEQLRLHGHQDLGLVNPLLYTIGHSASLASQVFSDVTQGSNDVGPFISSTGGQPLGCCGAAPGFDEASGWGSINVSQLANVSLSLAPKIVDVGLSLPNKQHPAASRKILATVSCSGACLMGAEARIRIGRGKPFVVASAIYRLKSKGRRTIAIKLSRSQANRMKGKHGVIEVIGAIVDPGGNIEKQTPAQRLTF